MLAPILMRWPLISKVLPIVSINCRASSGAPVPPACSRWMTTNSSPPSRAICATLAQHSLMRSETATSSRSPIGWPSVSLTDLKWSRSIRCNASSEPAGSTSRALRNTSLNEARFIRPVSSSIQASCSMRSCALACSVTSSKTITALPFSMLWQETATTRASLKRTKRCGALPERTQARMASTSGARTSTERCEAARRARKVSSDMPASKVEFGAIEDRDQLVVPHQQRAGAVEHAEPVRHVVERGVKKVRLVLVGGGEFDVLALGLERPDNGVAHRNGDVGHAEHEDEEHAADGLVEEGRVQDEAEAHRGRGEVELGQRRLRASGIAACDAGGIAGGKRRQHEVEGGVFRGGDGHEGQQAEQERIERCRRDIGDFPEADVAGVHRLLAGNVLEGDGNADQRHADDDDGQHFEQQVLGEDCHRRRDPDAGEGARDQRGERVEQAIDKLLPDLGRQLALRSQHLR